MMLDTKENTLYKCINVEELLLSVSILTYLIKMWRKKKHKMKWLSKAPLCHKHFSWNKKPDSLCDWVKTCLEDIIRMTQEDLGSGSTYVHWQNWMEGLGHHFAHQDSLVLPDIVFRMLFPVLMTWTFSFATFLPFLSFLFCMFFGMLGLVPWVVVQNALCRHAGEWCTQVACDCQPVVHLPKMGGYVLSVSPQLETPGAKWL